MDYVDQQIVGPRRRMVAREHFARERLAAAKQKRRIKKPSKAHSTNRERSREKSARAKDLGHAIAARRIERAAFLQAAREYWAGARDTHP